MIRYCPVCHSSDVIFLRSYRATHSIFNGLSLLRCDSCALCFASPMPESDSLQRYNESYFDSAHGGKANSVIANAFFTAIAKLRFCYVNKYTSKSNITVNKVLEIGPGSGGFASHWIDEYSPDVYYAVETDSSCHENLKGIGVTVIDNVDIINNETKIDLVVMSHVLEHVVNPYEFLEENTARLDDGGVVFIEVPCNDWLYKEIDEPHVLFFDKKSMLFLFSKLGFENIQISYHGPEIRKIGLISLLNTIWMKVRTKLIMLGLITPFALKSKGLESIKIPMERAVVKPFKAHKESVSPSWWLRVIATKSGR